LATPIPQADESAGSILLRASFHNGYQSPRKLLHSLAKLVDSHHSKKTESVIRSEKEIIKACTLLGINIPEEHAALPKQMKNASDHYLFCGVSVHRFSIRKTSHYCPECLEEKGYFLRVWDHVLVKACTKHEIKLVETCHVCQSAIFWDRKHLFKCDCGASLVTAPIQTMVCKSTTILTKIFETGNEQAYIDYLELRQVLTQYITEDDLEHLAKLLELGLQSPSKLGKALADEIIKNKEINFHPRLTFVDFKNSENLNVRKAAEIAKEIITKHQSFDALAHDYDLDDLLDYDAAAAAFGISRNQVKNLRQNSLLEGIKPKPNTEFRISKRSIHSLLMELGNLEIYKSRNSVSIAELVKDSRHRFTLTQVIEKVLAGEIKLSEFDWYKPLLSARIIPPPLPTKMRTNEEVLVSIEDFSLFTGFHPNVIRDLIKANSNIEHFNAGLTEGTRKYLIPENARKLFWILKGTVQKKSNLDRINQLSIDDIPTVTVNVSYPLDSKPERYAA
jgi:hypothetical protein